MRVDRVNDNSNSNNSASSSNDNQNNDKKQDVGHDTHTLWDKAIERKKQQEEKQEQSDSSREESENKQTEENNSLLDKKRMKQESITNDNKEKDKDNKLDEKKNEKKEQVKKITESGEKKTFQQNKIARKKQLEELRKKLAEQSYGYGPETNGDIRKIDVIGACAPLIDWRVLLKEAIKLDVDWSYRNASIENGVLTTYLEEIPKPEVEILLDTSGSINETFLRNFLR